MLPINALLAGFLLYLVAKLMERKIPFYVAALIYAVAYPLISVLITLQPINWQYLFTIVLVHFVVGLLIFYLLDYYEDTIAKWLMVFAAGFIVFAFVL